MDRPKEPGSYDVAEFDKTDPEEELRNRMASLNAIIGRMVDNGQDEAPDDVEDAELSGRALLMVRFKDMSERVHAGDIDGALDIVEKAAAAGRLTPEEALLGRQMVYNTADEPERELETIIRLEKTYSSTLPAGMKADLLYRLGRRDELAAWCDAWRESAGSGKMDLYLNRARLMRLTGDAAGALKHANAICVLDDRLLAGRMLAGDILVDTGDLREAVERYNEALDIDFRNVNAHVKKAEALVKMGRPDAAALACRRGLEVRPQNKRLKAILAET